MKVIRAYTMKLSRNQYILLSPPLIFVINLGNAYLFGAIIGKWAFVPIILIEWGLFLFFIFKYAGVSRIKKWLTKSDGSFGWTLLALFIGLIPLPIFLAHYETLDLWEVWLPWILLALINPWLEEFYWRGLLLDATQHWPKWTAIMFTSLLFAVNHAVFGVNSELNSGFTVIISTFIMGTVWALVYLKTNSLRWVILAHFLVDFLSLSAAAFLDLFEKGGW